MSRAINYTSRQVIEDRLRADIAGIAKEYINDLATPAEPQAVDWVMVEREIERKSDYIDSMIGGRYTVPLSSPVHAMIAEICYRLVACQLFSTPSGIPPDNRTQCEDAEQMLKSIADGTMDIPGLTKKTGGAAFIDPHPDLEKWDAVSTHSRPVLSA